MQLKRAEFKNKEMFNPLVFVKEKSKDLMLR